MTIGERIKKRREELNITQEELANTIGYKSKSTINKIEKDINDIPMNKISKFSNALKVSKEYIMGWEQNQEQSNIQYKLENNELQQIPLYSSISAGYGALELELIEYTVVAGLKGNINDYFAVRVRGDSMEDRINNKDIVIIKKDSPILNKEIGAFCLNGEYFLKQKIITDNGLCLHSFNNEYSDIFVKEYDSYKELGRVVKMIVEF